MDPQPDNAPGQSMTPPATQQGGFALPGPQSDPSVATAVSTTRSPQPSQLPQASSDEPSNELDQEWVRKAKSIVERTKDDPFLTSRELNKMKADYLKIRYNKHIKVAEDSQ